MPGPPESPLRQPVRLSCARRWHWLVFLLINGLILGAFFWPAIVGHAMLAPLDIAPNVFSKYRYVDPNATGVPANHYPVDLILGDVSRNLLVHEAWQRGEMPWWDPYTDGGKPLAAEANAVNVSDPFKALLFHALPFEPAYNWIRIVPFLLSGLTAFFLLQRFGFAFAPCAWGGLLYEFAGCNFVMFSGPTVQASFAYYPLLWLLWDVGIRQKRFVWFGLSAVVAALIFLSGNLQSHSYAFLFAIAFFIGYGWKQRERWPWLIGGTTCALLVGLGLASPFVLSQAELFFLSARKLHPAAHASALLTGLASVSTIFPWALGTFRTLDFSRFFGQMALGFWVYIGSAALIVAGLGAAWRARRNAAESDATRTAFALIMLYFVICSTPLLSVFYVRTAWLGLLGIIFFFARGWTFLCEIAVPPKRWAGAVLMAAVGIAAAVHIAAGLVYPAFQSRIEARFVEAQQTNPAYGSAPALRHFQVQNFSNEVTFKNIETVFAFLGMVLLGVFLLKLFVPRTAALNVILISSTFPLLAFGHRYIPMQPYSLWRQIREGGPEQQRVARELRPDGLRLYESAPGSHDFLFPGALCQLFQVHILHGHSSLILNGPGHVTDAAGAVPADLYDYKYETTVPGAETGRLVRAGHDRSSRFYWRDSSPRKITVESETLTKLTLAVPAGESGDLIRTDTFYPGWRAFSDAGELKVLFEPPCFSRVPVPANVGKVRFVFEPRLWRLGLWMASFSGLLLAGGLARTVKRRNIR